MKGYGDVSAADANKRHPLRSNGVNWTGKYWADTKIILFSHGGFYFAMEL